MSAATGLDERARRIVWGFLGGVTVLQGALIYLSFPTLFSQPWRIQQYTFAPPGTAAAWELAGAVVVLYAAYAAMRSPVIRAHMLSPGTWGLYLDVRLLAIPMALVTGFFEEAFFRKFLMTIAMHHGYGPVSQIAISAGVFGIAHGIWGIAGGNPRAAIGPMLSTSVLGALLAIVFLIGDRSLAPCAAAHIAINLLLEPWLIITSATRAWGKKQTA